MRLVAKKSSTKSKKRKVEAQLIKISPDTDLKDFAIAMITTTFVDCIYLLLGRWKRFTDNAARFSSAQKANLLMRLRADMNEWLESEWFEINCTVAGLEPLRTRERCYAVMNNFDIARMVANELEMRIKIPNLTGETCPKRLQLI